MAPRVRTHPGTRPTENGETLWTPKSLAHPARAHRPRIVTTPWRRTTLVSGACAPTPVWTAGCSSATSTNTAKRGKRPTLATAALIALVGSNWNCQGKRPCRECDGTGWVLYRSETLDGELEEAYSLCPQGHAPRYCMGYRDGYLCPRPATVRRGLGYYCKEHAILIHDGRGHDRRRPP